MKYISVLVLIALILSSCKTGTNADKPFKSDDKSGLTLRLHLSSGESFVYNIVSENRLNIDLNTKKIDNTSKTNVIVNYIFTKDSTGEYSMNITYQKIHLYLKNGEEITDVDAANADSSFDQMEKMLGMLKKANLSAQLGPLGEVRGVNDYKELGAKIVGQFTGNDSYSKKLMQGKWDQVVGEGMIKKNISDLFSFFPKKIIHEGDSWTVRSIQRTDIPMNIATTYKLESIEDSIAYLKSESDILSDSTINYQGTDVLANLKGDQEGEYTINMNTGMLVSGHTSFDVKGTLQILGRDFPIKMSAEVDIKKMNNR